MSTFDDFMIGQVVSRGEELNKKDEILASAVDCLRDIAALSRKQASEIAKHWLIQHGYARQEDGYVPGKGFEKDVE